MHEKIAFQQRLRVLIARVIRKVFLASCSILALLWILVYLGLIFDQDPLIPVVGAKTSDWNPDSFWHEPWGTSGVHKGIDIFAKKGTEVLASVGGLVVYRGELKLGGNSLTILGPRWRLHYFAHLDSLAAGIKIGNWVQKGEVIGTVGVSGNARGTPAHLHYAVMSMVPCPSRYSTRTQGWKLMFYLNPDQYLRPNMKLTKDDDSRTLQDRYSRVLGVDFSTPEEKLTDEAFSEKKSNGLWYLLLLVPLIIAFGTWILFQFLPDSTPSPAAPAAIPDSPPANLQGLPSPEASAKPGPTEVPQAVSAEPPLQQPPDAASESDRSIKAMGKAIQPEQAPADQSRRKQTVGDLRPSEQAPIVSMKSDAAVGKSRPTTSMAETKMHAPKPVKPRAEGSRVESLAKHASPRGTQEKRRVSTLSGTVFVVLLSTRSKEEAISRANEFGNKGHTSEVILSSSGYYGVVLRASSTDEAKNSIQAVLTQGLVGTTPYILPKGRIKQFVYP